MDTDMATEGPARAPLTVPPSSPAPTPRWRFTPWTPRAGAIAAGATLVALIALAYSGVTRLGFVWDDRTQVVSNPTLHSLRTALTAFTIDSWRLADPLHSPDAYFRPLGFISFALDRTLAGLSPAFFHLHNLALHMVVVLLLTQVLLTRPCTALFTGTLIASWFATLPVNTETVCWIGVRFDLLGTALFLSALLLQRRFAGTGGGWIGATFYFLALLSKESFIVIPIILLADEWTRGARPRLQRLIVRYAPHLIALAGYWALRRASGTLFPATAFTIRTLATDYLTTFGEVVRMLFAPLPLSVTRDYLPLSPLGLTASAAGALALLTLALYSRPARTGVALLLLGCALPAMAVRAQGFMAERYAYLPAIGAALLLAQLLGSLARGARPTAWRALAIAIALFTALQITVVRGRVPAWRDDRTLFSSALKVNPNSWYALFEMGHADARDGDWSGAAAWYRRALHVNAVDARLLSNASAAFTRTGALPEAIWTARRAALGNPANPRAHYNLAVALARAGELTDAQRAVERALTLAPHYGHARALAKEIDDALHPPRQP